MVDDSWLALVRVAQETGDISSLFPPGVERLIDMPFTIHQAILAAMQFISFGELPKEERPPKSIWLNGPKLEAWFVEVERLREDRMNGGNQSEMDRSDLKDRLIVGA